ncbi:MAG: hypothetical protein C4538_02500 [Nitrospiraceae bacterium]|nr:MAG: hypothetical protein C4538_02500 [Nitrospiraceae bacterium]
MGFLSSIFGKKEEYPLLDPGAPSTEQLNKFNAQLSELLNKVHDRIEVVPAENNVYVYIGKPPGMFGMVWFEDGKEVNFKSLVKDKGLSQKKVQTLSGKLGDVYERSKQYQRYTAKIADRDIIVTPSDAFEQEISQVIQGIEH